MKTIPYGRQNIDHKDLISVRNALFSELITTGKYVKILEENLKEFLGCKFVISCSSGTAAIHLALLSINLKKNDAVIIPAINFVAAANISKLLGAKVYFSDIDLTTGQSSPQNILDCIKKNKLKRVKVIFSMHLGGAPNYLKEMYLLKRKLRCFLIEDACHALGASYYDNKHSLKVGNARFSDISTFSFHPIKSITSGEGGAVSTNNKYIAGRIRLLRSHGITKKKGLNYDVVDHSLNYRLSDINCALAISQLKKINIFIKRRRDISRIYYKKIDNYKNVIQLLNKSSINFSACHLVIVLIDFNKLRINKNKFYDLLSKKNIFCQFHYIPQYKFSAFYENLILRNSEHYYQSAISLPIYYSLTNKSVDLVIKYIKEIVSKFLK